MTPVRYRCSNCGNLTRFDVTTTRRVRAFHHYSLGGDLRVDEEHVLAETVDEVSCRWCASSRGVEVVGEGLAGGDSGNRTAMSDKNDQDTATGTPKEVLGSGPGTGNDTDMQGAGPGSNESETSDNPSPS